MLRVVLSSVVLLLLAACGGGAATTSTAPTGSTSAPAATAVDHAPTIGGTAGTTATVGTAYSFKPNAADSDGDSLSFTIQNKPAWAALNAQTGELSGTPTAAGTFANIAIAVSDGKMSAALPAFQIVVAAAAATI